MTASFADFYSDEYTIEGYSQAYLEPAELHLLHRVSARLAQMDMLDLGVGAGRTAVFFAPFARSYVGIDVAPGMVETCRRRLAALGTPGATFRVGDAADLSAFADASFDFVLFSFNGIDCLDAAGRERCLREIRRVLRRAGGFAFASHNLRMIEHYFRVPAGALADPAAPDGHLATKFRRIREVNGSPEPLLAQDQISFWDGEYPDAPELRHIYIKPEFQVAELERLGFSEIEVISVRTAGVLDRHEIATTPEPWLYFWCRA